MHLIIRGAISGKKNRYGQTRTGRRFKPRDVVENESSIVGQILEQAGNVSPFIKPCIVAHFVYSHRGKDLDNMWTMIQDCLVKAGVLNDDNLNNLDGPIVLTSEYIKGEDYVHLNIVGEQE